MSNIKYLNNIFTESELNLLAISVQNSEKHHDPEYGRQMGKNLNNIGIIHNKVLSIAEDVFESPLSIASIISCTYSNEFGIPNLPPHFDGAAAGHIINFQLKSNTSWDIGLDLDLYPIKDNSALLFNANETAHWRPHKTFKDEEYVTMIFFRFKSTESEKIYNNPPSFHRPGPEGHGFNCIGCMSKPRSINEDLIDKIYKIRDAS